MSLFCWLDTHLGRGSYYPLARRLYPKRQFLSSVYRDQIAGMVAPGIRWLDAGTGHQILDTRLEREERDLVSKASLAVGCDIFLPALRNHRSLGERVCCGLDRLPFRDGSFDLVTMNMVVEHLDSPGRVFPEVARILDEGGCLIIHTPNLAGYFVLLVRLGWRLLPQRLVFRLIRQLEHRDPDDVFRTFYRANTRQRLAQLARQSGMSEERTLMLTGRPFFYFLAPLCVLEMLGVRFLQSIRFQGLASHTILGVYRRSPSPPSGGSVDRAAAI
jgi:SAM-dependent methyltransferase